MAGFWDRKGLGVTGEMPKMRVETGSTLTFISSQKPSEMTRNIPGSDTALSCPTTVPALGLGAVKCRLCMYSSFSSLALELLHSQHVAALLFEGEMFQDSA